VTGLPHNANVKLMVVAFDAYGNATASAVVRADAPDAAAAGSHGCSVGGPASASWLTLTLFGLALAALALRRRVAG
jgi:MYXO-CTERM domain-containing protein